MSTLGCSIIVESNQGGKLKRCLDSIISEPRIFDEINITRTTNDQELEELCNSYLSYSNYQGFNVSYFEWCDDFSAARNFSFDQLNTDYIFWLDSDDILPEKSKHEINQLKTSNFNNGNIIIFDYNYVFNQHGEPLMVVPRTSIVKNTQENRWQEPIHEYIPLKQGYINSTITLDHHRQSKDSSLRNLNILLKQYYSDSCSKRCKFYLAKELIQFKEYELGKKIMLEYISDNDGFVDYVSDACFILGDYAKNIEKDYEQVLMLCFTGLSVDKNKSSLWCLAAEAFELLNNFKLAIKCAQKALESNSKSSLSSTIVSYSQEIPNIILKRAIEKYNLDLNLKTPYSQIEKLL